MPFCVAGMGDLLALFRCISCRFSFQTDDTKPESLGAPGRVFLSGCPEMACNVQHYPPGTYLRIAEAAQCRVQAHMLLPVFASSPEDFNNKSKVSKAVAVIEIVQASDDMSFLPMAQLVRAVFSQTSGLYTSPESDVVEQLPREPTMVKLPLDTGWLMQQRDGSPSYSDIGEGKGDDNGVGSRRREQEIKEIGESSRIQNLNPKSGVNLTFQDLQSHFGVGLKEAAAALGVCVTTLKRACRRHGIQRWPRRALAKVSKALEEANGKGIPLPPPVPSLFPVPLAQLSASGGAVSGPASVDAGHDANDGRWVTLASMIPFAHPHLPHPPHPPQHSQGIQAYVNQPVYGMPVPSPLTTAWPNSGLTWQHADFNLNGESRLNYSSHKKKDGPVEIVQDEIGLFDPSILEFMQFDGLENGPGTLNRVF